MKILVVGGAGFIGRNLLHRLSAEGHDVISADTNEVKLLECNFTEKHIDILNSYRTSFGYLDPLRDVSKDVDVIVHLAAESGVIPSINHTIHSINTNIIGTVNVLESARHNKIKRVIFASSGGTILGEQNPPCDESTLPVPSSPYGATKVAGEALCNAYMSSFGIETVMLRFSNVYGPYSENKESVVSKFIQKCISNEPFTIYGDGTSTRDYVYVADVVEAILLALDPSYEVKSTNQVFQIASGVETSMLSLVEIMNDISYDVFENRIKIVMRDKRKGEVDRNYAIITKARDILGWVPKCSLQDGLRETFEWFYETYM